MRWDITTPAISIAASLVLVGVMLAVMGINPLEAYYVMFSRSFASKFGLSELCVKTTPIILTGLAVAIPLRAGLWNIGAEGQLYIGAFAASVVALYTNLPDFLMLPAMFVVAAVFGMGWAAIPGVLKAKFDLNEIISTLLLNYVAIYWVEFMVYGPMRGKEVYNFPYTDLFPDAATLPRFFGTRFHLGFFVAIIMAILMYYLVKKTGFGFSLRVVGSNPRAADYAGISREKMIIYSMMIGGMLAGIAGMIEVSGIQLRLRPIISTGYGYAGIPVALLASGNPLLVLLSASLFGFLYVGGSALQTTYSVPVAIVYVFQALIVLFIIAGQSFRRGE
jgi:simple sugar transport system permease protein